MSIMKKGTSLTLSLLMAIFAVCLFLLPARNVMAAEAGAADESAPAAEGAAEAGAAEAGTADAPEDSPEWVGALKDASDAEQILVVAAVGKTTAYVSMHQKDDAGEWKQIMTTPGYIGKKGLGKTKEGDGKTPVGTYHFNYAFGIADDPGCALPYQKVDEDSYWSGDNRDGYQYNHMVSLKDLPDLNKEDSERILDYTEHYQYCLNISYNEEGTPGLGSAIFLHCLGPQKPYTGGCVAIPQDKMMTVMQNVREDCVVVIDSMENLAPDVWSEWAPGHAGKQTAEAYLDQDGSTVDVKVDISDGWSASFARGAVYLYDGEDDGEREAIAMGITLEKDVYDDYMKNAADNKDYKEEDGAVFYTDDSGESICITRVGDAAYFMISVSKEADAEEVMARFTVEPD